MQEQLTKKMTMQTALLSVGIAVVVVLIGLTLLAWYQLFRTQSVVEDPYVESSPSVREKTEFTRRTIKSVEDQRMYLKEQLEKDPPADTDKQRETLGIQIEQDTAAALDQTETQSGESTAEAGRAAQRAELHELLGE